MRIIAIMIAALVLAGCGAGYNPGCEGKEETSAWCEYNPP